jgi:hypothetical protein
LNEWFRGPNPVLGLLSPPFESKTVAGVASVIAEAAGTVRWELVFSVLLHHLPGRRSPAQDAFAFALL